MLQVDVNALAALNLLGGVADDRKRAQSQKVHFKQAQLLHRAHGILRGNHAVVDVERYVFVHRAVADDHARRVGGGVAGQALQAHGHVQQPFGVLFFVVGRF
jgi:hypothetical protein